MHAQSKKEPMSDINIAMEKTLQGFRVPAVRINGNKNALKVCVVLLAWRLDREMRR